MGNENVVQGAELRETQRAGVTVRDVTVYRDGARLVEVTGPFRVRVMCRPGQVPKFPQRPGQDGKLYPAIENEVDGVRAAMDHLDAMPAAADAGTPF